MAQEERYGARSLAYSAWHRRQSIGRYVGIEKAQTLAMIDMDHVLWVEYDDHSKEPVALIEEAQDIGQPGKIATVTRNLARRADLPAFVILWTAGEQPNPVSPKWPDIERFRVKRLWPPTPNPWRQLTPEQWAQTLVRMRIWQAERLDKELFGNA